MSFYFIQLFIFILYSLIFIGLDVQTAGAFSNINNKYFFEKLYCFISIIYLSLVMGLRSNTVGTDTPLYVYNYLINSQISEDTFSYNWLSKMVFGLTNGNYHAFLLVTSFVIVTSIVIGLWRIYSYFEIQYKTFYLFFSLYIYITYYYYFEAFNIFRQSLAGAIAFLAVSFLFTRNYFKSLFLFILAVGIHNTVIVLIVLIPVILIKKNRKGLFIWGIFSVLIGYLNPILIEYFASFSDHYLMYNEQTVDNLSSAGGSAVVGIFMLFFVYLSVINCDIYENQSLMSLVCIIFMAGILYIIGMRSQLIVRIADYMGIFIIAALPLIIGFRSKFKRNISLSYLFWLVILVGLALMSYKMYKNMGGIIPYVL